VQTSTNLLSALLLGLFCLSHAAVAAELSPYSPPPSQAPALTPPSPPTLQSQQTYYQQFAADVGRLNQLQISELETELQRRKAEAYKFGKIAEANHYDILLKILAERKQ